MKLEVNPTTTMRTREEIEKEFEGLLKNGFMSESYQLNMIVNLLLDIRDLLSTKDKER